MKVFSACLLISFIGLAVSVDPPVCSSDFEELWPHPDPTHFWYCHHAGSTPIDIPCPAGRGFLRNDDRSGCIPFEDWECTARSSRPPACNSGEYLQPHRHPNPRQFWGCPGLNEAPQLLTCEKGRAFVSNSANLGCVPFNDWVCNEAGNKNRY